METLPQTIPQDSPDISAWLPDSPLIQKVNMHEAIKNYCIAYSDEMYSEFCHVHALDHRNGGPVQWAMPDRVLQFEQPIIDTLTYLYSKYLTMLPMYKGFPQGVELSLGMKPPSPNQFKVMLKAEHLIKG